MPTRVLYEIILKLLTFSSIKLNLVRLLKDTTLRQINELAELLNINLDLESTQKLQAE